MNFLRIVILSCISFYSMNGVSEVRCVAKLKIEKIYELNPKAEQAVSQLKFDYIIIEAPKEYWRNSCELDFSYAIGKVDASKEMMNYFKLGSVVYVIGEYEDGKFTTCYYKEPYESQLLERIVWSSNN